jgi:hypothetical protein
MPWKVLIQPTIFADTSQLPRSLPPIAPVAGRPRNFDFVLVAPPDTAPAEIRAQCVHLQLDRPALARKRIAAENYPELKEEIDAAISKFGLEVFATELLRPVAANLSAGFDDQPSYEIHGGNRVKEGHYHQVIRYRAHFRPLMEALWRELDLPIPGQ